METLPRGAHLDWNAGDWNVRPLPAVRAGGADPLVARLLTNPRLAFGGAALAAPRRGAGPALELTLTLPRGEAAVVLARRASGAVTLHPPIAHGRDGALAFRVERSPTPARRSADRAIRLFVLRVVGRAADRALPDLARAWEETHREKRGLTFGFVRMTRGALLDGRLPRASREVAALPPPPARSLVFVHGIFSDAESAFRGLATTGGGEPLARLLERYDGRVFAFNHPTVGTSPLENARAFLDSLPPRPSLVDVVTHSRGGIVLRSLVEHPSLAKERAAKLSLGRVVLAAAPNRGSALADPGRWHDAMGWVANLAETFPLSAFGDSLDLVSESIVWMAHRASGALPGLGPLAPGSALLSSLRGGVAPHAAAIATSYVPPPSLLPRLVDAGASAFFGGANDLVVPTEGGFRLAAGAAVDGARVLCFGPGGNAREGGLHHLELFDSAEAVDFAERALAGEAPAQAPLDVSRDLPAGRARRGASARAEAATTERRTRRDGGAAGTRLELVLLPISAGAATLLASWGRARAVAEVATKGGEAGERMRRVIALHERIRRTLDGRIAGALPENGELTEYGTLLFDTLFRGDVLRLYDQARARARRKLDVVFASSVGWVADKPWELAFDARRGAFLAAEDVNFVRDVFTAVPEERRPRRRGPLSVLVASAEPRGLAPLAVREEVRLVESALAPLADAGLVRVSSLAHATPEALHGALAKGRPDVLHFIGHGVFREAAGAGALVLEGDGRRPRELGAEALRSLLSGRGLRLVFLNACETARGPRSDFNRGAAPAIAAAGVPAVVANQYSVLDTAATAFARRFYESIALGESLGDAVREARVAVRMAERESIAWATPVVFARDPSLALTRRPTS